MPTTTPMRTPTAPKPAGTAPMTPQAIAQTPSAANVQIGTQTTAQTPSAANVQIYTKPNTGTINPQNLEKEIGDRLKDPTFGKDFAELLARVMQRK